MLARFYSDQRALERLRNEKAGDHLDGFVGWLDQQGYSAATIRSYVPEVVYFTHWIDKKGIECRTPGREGLDLYREHLASIGHLHRGNRYCAVQRFITYLEASGLGRKLKNNHPTSGLLTDFQSWMQRHRGVIDSTLSGYCLVIRDLIETIGEDTEQYTAQSLRSFVLDRSSQYGRSKAQGIVTSVRMFVRFLVSTRQCKASLEHSIPRFARWRQSSLPKYIPEEDVERIISCCDPSTPLGARDHAIMLLLARLGLRASDVAGLNLEDIDWARGQLLVCGKNRRHVWLPLPQDVGDAILHYTRYARPAVKHNRLFIISRAPYSPIHVRQISQTAQRAIRRAGIKTCSQGSHLFRHSLATAMLRQGVSLQCIGTLLRHTSIETTMIYAKVDVEMLKEVALPWPEVAP